MSDWIGLFLANGRYQVIAKLPGDRLTEVYRAWDHLGETEVIVKVPGSEQSIDAAGSFAEALRPLVTLDHPHLVRTLDVGAHAGVAFAVVESIKGDTLRGRQKLDLDNKPLPMSFVETADWLEKVADALDYLHSQHVVHRAVEPCHILFDKWDLAFLGDLCSQQALVPLGHLGEASDSLATAGGHGATKYLAPEARCGAATDGRADQFSLALVVHETLTGSCSYDGSTPAALLVRKRQQESDPAHPRRRPLPRDVVRALMKALAENPAARYPSCGAFARAVIEGLARRPSRWTAPAPLPQSLRLFLTATVAVVVLVALGLAGLIAYDYLERGLGRARENTSGSVERASDRSRSGETSGKPGTITASDGKQYRSIREALRSVQPGTRLRLGPGVYTEPVVITVPVEIVGAGPRQDIVLESVDGPCLSMRAAHALVRGLTLRSRAPHAREAFPTVDIPGGRLVLEECDIGSSSLACVTVRGSEARPILRRCRISGKGSGIIFSKASKGTVEECDIVGNASVAVEVREESDPLLRKCRCCDHNSGGVLVHRGGKGTLEDCTIAGNYGAGITTHGGGQPLVRRCAIRNNVEAGVHVKSTGGISLERCEVRGNGQAGIKVQWGGIALVRDSTVSDNALAGVQVGNTGRATVEHCNLTRNRQGPWSLAGAAKVRQVDNVE